MRTQSLNTYDMNDSKRINDEAWKKHARDAGINLNVPGQSEHQYRFAKPTENNFKNFTLNPQPDVDRFNRPFASALIEPLRTEYSDRFQFPDAARIDKFPWIKNF